MSVFRMKLPDVGEGVAEAEIVSWLVAVGDEVTPNSVLAEVLTDKATVEVSSPVTGVVAALHGEPGDILAVGSDLIEIDTGDADEAADEPAGDGAVTPEIEGDEDVAEPGVAASEPATPAERGPRRTAAPAVRARAQALGLNLADVKGTGPEGRVVHADLDRVVAGGTAARTRSAGSDEFRQEPVRGVRRQIAERLSRAWAEIPHITYVDAVDATEVERLRGELNGRHGDLRVRLTILPFIVRAIVIACAEQPHLNAHYDHAAETLTIFEAVHVGIATQTDTGLLVPVIRSVETLGMWDIAAELGRVTAAARDGSATRGELSNSTITITSLGALGGLVTTPILNPPQVAIVGVNKMEIRPVWRNGSFEPRQMFNLSSSFDHRMIDGWDAATFVQRIKSLLETPALLFVGDE